MKIVDRAGCAPLANHDHAATPTPRASRDYRDPMACEHRSHTLRTAFTKSGPVRRFYGSREVRVAELGSLLYAGRTVGANALAGDETCTDEGIPRRRTSKCEYHSANHSGGVREPAVINFGGCNDHSHVRVSQGPCGVALSIGPWEFGFRRFLL